jgi:GT2 family glycosyltransferase
MIDVVLVNWNGHADTRQRLEALARRSVAYPCVLVVDNTSADGFEGGAAIMTSPAAREGRA